MARGLYRFCAEKWSKGHKCSTIVQLHAVQELWELLESDQEETFNGTQFEEEFQCNFLLSQEAISVSNTSKSMRFWGSLRGHEVLVLVDSRSSNSFVNAKFTSVLSEISQLA
jgi:hypothetical protein